MRFGSLVALLFVLAACQGERDGRMGAAQTDSALADGPLAEPPLPRSATAPLTQLGRNGMRVSIAPAAGDYGYVVDFLTQPDHCDRPGDTAGGGVRVMRDDCRRVEVRFGRIGRGPRTGQIFYDQFWVPVRKVHEAMARFEALAARWRGPDEPANGTAIGVELYRDGRLRSLVAYGDDAGNPAAALAEEAHGMVRAHGPAWMVPRSPRFTPDGGGAEAPCPPAEGAAPAPDEPGAGNHFCTGRPAPPLPAANETAP